jgi:uncharacterized protein YbcI
MTAASNPTRAQLERALSQRIQSLYREQLGHRLGRVICQFFERKVAIVLEEATIPPEQLLLLNNREDFAKKLRLELDEAIEPQLKAVIEEVTGVSVLTLLSDTDLEDQTSSIVATLSDVPLVRDPDSIPKARLRQRPADANLEP